MSVISNAATDAREAARESSGQFGEQKHSAPETTLATDDGRAAAIASFERILANYPEQAAHVRDFIEPKLGKLWAPDLVYVGYDDKLMDEQLDAYLRGDDEPLDELDSRYREGEAYEDAVRIYLNEITGIEPSDFDDDTFDQLRELVVELDTSDVIQSLARFNQNALVQLPIVDDDAFGAELERVSQEKDDELRYTLIESTFANALTRAGVTVDEINKRAIRELIDETSLDFGFQSAEQWKLRLVTSTDPRQLAMSSYAEHGDAERKISIEYPFLLLVDPWNGRSHDTKLAGVVTTTIDAEHPARLDAVLGNGSLDAIAGVVHSSYRTPVKVVTT